MPLPVRDLRAAFGLTVRRRRIEMGIAQERLAEMAEVERAYVSALENGKRNPTLATQQRLAAALGATLESLLGEAEGMS